MHVFPDGKRYVGSTCMPLRVRWDGGLGYVSQSRMFSAILKHGWENIKHYVLLDGLDRDTALDIEARLIRQWKTYTKGKGYNAIVPKVRVYAELDVPELTPRRIDDHWDDSIQSRCEARFRNCNSSEKRKPVRLTETGEVFPSATKAARAIGVSVACISRAARTPGATCGTCYIEAPISGALIERPAHWEYVHDTATSSNFEQKGER